MIVLTFKMSDKDESFIINSAISWVSSKDKFPSRYAANFSMLTGLVNVLAIVCLLSANAQKLSFC